MWTGLTGGPQGPSVSRARQRLAFVAGSVMAFDQVGLNIVGKLEELLPPPGSLPWRAEAVVRCRAIINALEVQIEEDAQPPESEVVGLLGSAFVRQAPVAGLDASLASRAISSLIDHLQRR